MRFTPEDEANMVVEQAELVAADMLMNMDGVECTKMVRDFCKVMIDWQENIAENREDPMALGIHCLAAAELFKLAFVKSYTEVDKRMKAEKSIRQALGGIE